jgi:hypothetical protein
LVGFLGEKAPALGLGARRCGFGLGPAQCRGRTARSGP